MCGEQPLQKCTPLTASHPLPARFQRTSAMPGIAPQRKTAACAAVRGCQRVVFAEIRLPSRSFPGPRSAAQREWEPPLFPPRLHSRLYDARCRLRGRKSDPSTYQSLSPLVPRSLRPFCRIRSLTGAARQFTPTLPSAPAGNLSASSAVPGVAACGSPSTPPGARARA